MLLLLEGFDHFLIDGSPTFVYRKNWSGPAFGRGPGRFPYGAQSHSVVIVPNNEIFHPVISPTGDAIIGCAINLNEVNTRLLIAGTVRVGVDSDGHVYYSVNNVLAATGTSVLQANTWYYLEVKLSGVEVRVNGVTEIGPTADSAGPFNKITLEYTNTFGPAGLFDDLYVLDTTGGINDDFLGELCVETLYPISDGTYSDWTPLSGSDHWPQVSEFIFDSDGSYVETAVAGNKDSYGVGNPPLLETPVYGVQLNLGVRKTGGGTREVAPLIRQAATDYSGPTDYISTDYRFFSWLLDQDPSGSDWLYTTVNADEYGIELVA